MYEAFGSNSLPRQRVGKTEKDKKEWYANCIDYIVAMGLQCNDRDDTELKLNILHGDIPNSFYKKTLNPYNANEEKYKRFPATMRNFDIMSDIVRRYIAEYFKGSHEFIVGASNPEIALQRNAKLKEQVLLECQKAFKEAFEAQYNQMVQQAQQNGTDPKMINPQDAMPNEEEFIANFNKNYIDKNSKQGADVLEYVRAMTNDLLIYLTCYFNYVTLGEAFTYCEVRNKKIFKESVPPTEAYPIPNNSFFIEDHDMFARRSMLSYSQIMDMFDNDLDDDDRKFIETYYYDGRATGTTKTLTYNSYINMFPDVASKFSNEEIDMFKKSPITLSDKNGTLFEVWHVVWKGEARRGILTYINEIGLRTTRVVDEDYVLDKTKGDLEIEWAYEPQVYEGYRIGTRNTGIYPIKYRPIAYQREGKLPYNGIIEILPLFGKFSIIESITPYQILRNIMIYHREMVIAKNKMLLLLMPQSLIGGDENAEDFIYKMAAEGILLVDDTEDFNAAKLQQVRLLNANMYDYITQLTNLIETIKIGARESVDMSQQRYGQITQSATAGNTKEAIAQSSTGTVILTTMFDMFRKTDYNRDLDFAKLAFIDGLTDNYTDEGGHAKYISLDVNSFVNSDYSTMVKNDAKEIDKLNQLRQFAFSAAQNGEIESSIAAITGDNVSQIKSLIEQYAEVKRKHEDDMQQTEQAIKQMDIENKLKEIAAKGEEDRKTLELKANYELQAKSMDIDVSLLGDNVSGSEDEAARRNLALMAETNKTNIARQKLANDSLATKADLYNKAADRQVRREAIKTQLEIAKANRNKYDK